MTDLRLGDKVRILSEFEVMDIDDAGLVDIELSKRIYGDYRLYRLYSFDPSELERIPDPLPTAVGSVVEATVLGERQILMLIEEIDKSRSWKAAKAGYGMHIGDNALREVRVIYDAGV